MKKLQKLLSLSIAMTMLVISMTSCSDNNSTTPANTNETTQEVTAENVVDEVVVDEDVVDEDVADEDVADEDVVDEDVVDEDVVDEDIVDEDAVDEDVVDEDVVDEDAADEIYEDPDGYVADLTEDDVNTGATIPSSSTYFEQLAPPEAGETIATIKVTGFGEIKLKFFSDKTPLAVENFITHAESGYYDGIIFHRVINDFMIQGGDPTGTGMGGSSIWGSPFVNEDHADLYHFNGALSMANAGPDTNGSQFFIVNSSTSTPKSSSRSEFSDYANYVYTSIGGTPFLDGGYTVFGQVYEGLEIVESIMKVKTTGAEGSTPVDNVVIESIVISKY